MSKQAKQEIRACTFEMEISQGSGNIKFPCSCYVQWKTINGKDATKSANRVKLEQRKLLFNETIHLTTHMILDFRQEHYHKKDSILILNLVSNSRPNEPKLVGRVNVELGKIANQTHISQFKKHILQFCSVEASLTFRVSLKASLPTNLALSDLQRSDYMDIQPLVSGRPSQIEQPKIQIKNPPPAPSLINHQSSIQDKKEKNSSKPSQSSFQERLNRLKAQNENLKGSKLSENFNSRVKKEIDQNIKEEIQQNSPQQIKQSNKLRELPKQQRVLQTDFSVPMLAKESDQFDSNKILENSFNEYDRTQQKEKSIFRPKDSENISLFQAKTEQLSQASFKNRDNNNQKEAIKYQNEINNLKFIIEKIQVEKSILENQINKKNTDQLQLNHENGRLIDKINTLFNQLQEKQNIINEYESNHYQDKFQQAIMNLQERQQYIKELQQKYHLCQERLHQALQQINAKSYQKQLKESSQVIEGGQKTNQLENTIEELKYKLQMQERNHSNSKIELNEVRQWYKLLQEQSQSLSDENTSLKEHVYLLQKQNEDLKIEVEKKSEAAYKNNQDQKLKQQRQQMQTNLANHLAQVTNQLAQAKDYIQHSQQIEQALNLELQSSKNQLQLIQIKYLELQTQTNQLRKQLQMLRRDNEQKNNRISEVSINLTRKSEESDDFQKKSNDLIKRLKQKEQNVLKAQRDSQQFQSKLKVTQNNYEKLKQKASQLQSQKNGDRQKMIILEKDLRLLKAKYQKQAEISNRQIEKLRKSLQFQSSKRKQLVISQKQTQSRLNSKIHQASRQTQLQEKISKHIWKEQQLKEQLSVLENELTKISQILQQKQENEDKYAQSIVIVTNQNNLIRARISEIEKECQLLIERNQGLQAQIELLNAYQPNEQSSSQTLQLNKKLVEKNKQLLNQIEEKNQAISSLERYEGTMKGKEVEQMLSKSRIQRQNGQIRQKYESLLQENEKLEQYMSNLTQRYEQEIKHLKQSLQINLSNSQSKVQQLYGKLTQQELKYVDQQMKFKEQIDNIQQDLHEKQYQIQYQKNQSKQLAMTLQTLKEKLANKEIQLLLSLNKISEQQYSMLQYQMIKEEHNFVKSDSQRVIQQLQSSQSKIKFYEQEIEKLHEKQFLLEKQVITLSQQLSKFKENGDQQIRHIAYLEGQIKNFRERQTQYIQEIEKLQSTSKLANSKCSKIQKDKNQLIFQIQKLTQEVKDLQSKKQKQSSQGTPVNKFKSSPSPQKQNFDLSDVVSEINMILLKRKEEEQLQNALRLVIDNNSKQEEEFQRWNRERGLIQEKAKLISKQLQKIKSSILKTPNRSITQKTNLSNLLKPAELVINDLVKLSQTLIQMDPFQEQEEQFDQNGVSS